MKKTISVILTILIAFSLASCSGTQVNIVNGQGGTGNAAADTDRETMYQVSLLQGLTLGDYHGSVSAAELKRHGDIGLGTFNGLNGEMIVIDGRIYRAAGDGNVEEVSDDETIPFSNVTFLDSDFSQEIDGADDFNALISILNEVVEERGVNRFYIVRIDGTFSEMNVRSELEQEEPYKPLAKVLETDQTFFDYENIDGTLVCLYCPPYMDRLNATGWHLHFISEDRTKGGHVLGLKLDKGTATWDDTDTFEMALPDSGMFSGFDLTIDQSEDIEKVEKPDNSNIIEFPSENVIGIAWRADTDSEFYTNICAAITAAGGTYVMLPQVKSAGLRYSTNGTLTEGVDENGALTADAGRIIRDTSWHGSNAADAVKNVSAVIFTGGEDVSPSLYLKQETWHGIEAEKDYNAERDVSDYVLMSCCADNDIPLAGFCRGMQMLSVLSGGTVIQDIPTYFADEGLSYDYQHRNEKATPDSYRDYASHSIVIERNSYLFDIVGRSTLEGCPSWHHQAIESVDNTPLRVTGSVNTGGVQIIEAVERTDKTFAVGFQFHPEAAIVKHQTGAENAANYMDYDVAIRFFRRIIEAGKQAADKAA